ncbi:MAG: hypothetical protein PVJ20_03720 [Desulfobacterales bacterium]|jgi:hypothetical protein
MKGKVNRAEAYQSEGGLIQLYHINVGKATAQFHFDTSQLAAGSFIPELIIPSIQFFQSDGISYH